MKIKSAVVTMLVMLLFTYVQAQAVTMDLEWDIAERSVKVSGTATPNSVITMVISSRDDEKTEITPENAKERVFAGDQIKADGDGNYERVFTLEDRETESGAVNGWYSVNLFSAADAEYSQKAFYMPGAEVGEMMIEEVNSSTADDLYGLVDKYSSDMPLLSVDIADYTPYQSEISELMLKERGSGFKTAAQFENIAKAVIGKVNLKHCEKEDVEEIALKYAKNIGFTAEEWVKGCRGETVELFLASREKTDTEKIDALFIRSMALSILNNSAKSEIENVLKRYNDIFGVDTDAYSKYSPIEISKALYGNNYTDTAQVKADFDKRVEELAELKNKKPSGGGGGSGGGSFGGKGGSFAVDKDMYTEITEESILPFVDLKEHNWAYGYVKHLYAAGIIAGVGEGRFEPDAPVKRSEISKMICKALNTEVVLGDNPFTDVDGSAWYAEYVINAYENELIVGYENRFEPEKNILRRDLALIIARALKNNGADYKEGTSFDDITEDDRYAEEAIRMLAAYGIINGKGGNRFAPSDNVTRAEAAKIIYNMMEVLGGV